MAMYTRETFPTLLKDTEVTASPVYLLYGERYLCLDAAKKIEQILTTKGGTIHSIDGDQEDISTTISKLRSYSLLPGQQVFKVTDTRLFHSKKVAKSLWNRAVKAFKEKKPNQVRRCLLGLLAAGGLDPTAEDSNLEELSGSEWQQCFGFQRPSGDLSWTGDYLGPGSSAASSSPPATTDSTDLFLQTLEAGIPQANTLLLLAEEVDKRKKLFKVLKKKYVVVDMQVDAGSGAKAQKAQQTVLRDLVQETLKEGNKTMAPGVGELLFERVGFQPIAAVTETRKLMLAIGERQQITREDLDAMVGRTRQEALFELTGAISAQNLKQTLLIAGRLLDNGIHPLAVVATLRNFTRNLLLFRALQEQPQYQYNASMSASAFQQKCLPLLKEQPCWHKELKGHPYALYMQFKTAAIFPLPTLTKWLKLQLSADIRLKGSPVAAKTVLHHLLLCMFTKE